MTVQLTIRMIRCYQGYAKMIYVCTIVSLPTFSTSKISGSECTGVTGASLNVSNSRLTRSASCPSDTSPHDTPLHIQSQVNRLHVDLPRRVITSHKYY